VTTSTHELAGLISTLHDFQPRLSTVPLFLAHMRINLSGRRAGRASFVRGVYREKHRASQRAMGFKLVLSSLLSGSLYDRISGPLFSPPRNLARVHIS
jgi:hypothetical protein